MSAADYIVSAMRPYSADAKNDDTSITKYLLLNNWESIVDWLQSGDILIVDYGFRDYMLLLNDLDYDTYMSASLRKVDKQLTTTDPNLRRFATKTR